MRTSPPLALALLVAAACADELPTDTFEEAAVFDPGAGVVFDPLEPPMRSAVLGLPAGGTSPVRRFWSPFGAGELSEMTGPNDKVIVGDFRQLGYDQVLALNFENACPGRATSCQVRRAVLTSFSTSAAPGSAPPAPLWSELWGQGTWLDNFDDETDLALAGDFLGRGYDQLLLINRPADGVIDATTPRAKILDLRGTTPVVAFQHDYGHLNLDEMVQLDDRVLVGDFRALGRDQVMILNGDPNRLGRALVVHDFASAVGPLVPILYSKSFAEVPALDTWHDAADTVLAGNFRGLGHDQLLFINRSHGAGRFRMIDLRWDPTPITWFTEQASAYPSEAPWHDALSDWMYTGDFAGLGRDQVLFLNRNGQGERAVVADFGLGLPAPLRFRQLHGPSSALDEFDDDDDLLLAGKFTPAGDGLLGFDNSRAWQTAPERLVSTKEELVSTLAAPRFRGRVVVPWWANWTICAATQQSCSPLMLRTGTQLIGERGPLGSRPTLRFDWDGELWGGLVMAGHHILVQGLHLIGPADDSRSSSQKASAAILGNVYASRGIGLYVTVVDNELEHWTYAAYSLDNRHLAGTSDERQPYADPNHVDDRFPRQAPEDVSMIRFERNYVHRNHRNGLGYGVCTGGGVYITIAGNVFDRNRHAVSAGGYPHSGYTARHNFILQGGYTESGFLGVDYWNQHFDVHGTGDGGYGGLAGEQFIIEHNTVRGEQDYGVFQTRPAFKLRGRPSMGAFFRNNVVVHDDFDEAIEFQVDGDGPYSPADYNLFTSPGNTYDTDHIDELVSGDFDGDGRTDVFLANGTAWFVSWAGSTEWRFLRGSSLVRSQLLFADIDNDGKTDVLWRDSAGRILYARQGGETTVYLTTAPVSIDQLRAGDLSGDGKADLFYVLGTQWNSWDGATGLWSVINSLGGSPSAMRLGLFDPYPGLDVAMAVDGYWQFSSAGRSSWRNLSPAWVPSMANTAAVDLDRDGRTDLVWREGSQWKWSRFGFFGPSVLRSGVDAGRDEVTRVLWGNFNNLGPTDALRWHTSNETFAVWAGLGSPDAAAPLTVPMK